MFKKLFSHQHDFNLSYLVGDFHKYYCKNKNCTEVKYTLETRLTSEIVDGKFIWTEPTITVLTQEEAEPYINKSEASLKATMWILDNVEPTASAGRDDHVDYTHKIENGQVVKK